MENNLLEESNELIKKINKRFQQVSPKISNLKVEGKFGLMPDINLMMELDKLRMDSIALQMKMERI